MMKAATEVRQHVNNTGSGIAIMKCGVLVDGSWQRRGHSSHNGVVTAISVETGKCLDMAVLTNLCRSCQRWEKRKGTAEYEI